MVQKYIYSILNTIDEAVCISDVEGAINYVHSANEHLTHLTKEVSIRPLRLWKAMDMA